MHVSADETEILCNISTSALDVPTALSGQQDESRKTVKMVARKMMEAGKGVTQ
jgi:hypothetical protein